MVVAIDMDAEFVSDNPLRLHRRWKLLSAMYRYVGGSGSLYHSENISRMLSLIVITGAILGSRFGARKLSQRTASTPFSVAGRGVSSVCL